MWDPKPGEEYVAGQFWDTFESWGDQFQPCFGALGKGLASFRLLEDSSRRDDIRRAHFELAEERRLPFWVSAIRVEVSSHLVRRPELAEWVRQATTFSLEVCDKPQVVMLAAAELLRCDALPRTPGIEVPPHPEGSYGAELTMNDHVLAEALSRLKGSPATGGDWLLIRTYLHVTKLKEVK